MTSLTTNTDLIKKFGKYSIFTGFLLILLGITGVMLPEIMSIETTLFVASFMLVGSIFWAIHTFKYSRTSVMDWLKPLILLIVGTVLLFNPGLGIAALGLFLAFYLMLDAFSSFSMAQILYPDKGWGWMLINGFISLLLSLLFLFGWPQSSLWLVGLFVAISLFFDGLSLVIIGWIAKST